MRSTDDDSLLQVRSVRCAAYSIWQCRSINAVTSDLGWFRCSSTPLVDFLRYCYQQN
jgi:hypothetical protein